MIGIIQFRLSTEPAAQLWTDAQWRALMDPARNFSLAHYWSKSSFGVADLRFNLFPPVTVVDPLPGMTEAELKADNSGRDRRTKAIVQAVDDSFHPDWGSLNTLILWCASGFDLWGSSAIDHGHGICAVMTCSAYSRFDQLCHELGHTLGFSHPFGSRGEYDSPYDIMGGYDAEWTRGPIPDLPMGKTDPPGGTDPLRLIGPQLSAAQLAESATHRQRFPQLFSDLPPGAQQTPTDVTLHALDLAADRPGDVDPVAAHMPPNVVSPDNSYYLELRRSLGYDGGVRAGVVVHGFDKRLHRFWYAGRLPLTNNLGDKDLHVFASGAGSDFTVRLLEVGAGDEWAKVRVGGPNYWRNFGVDIDIQETVGEAVTTDWESIETRPCPFAQAGTYQYRYVVTPRSFDVTASSYGYETPHYTWLLDGQELAPTAGDRVEVKVQPRPVTPSHAHDHDGDEVAVHLPYTLQGERLHLGSPEEDPVTIGDISLPLELTVNETSPGVIQSNYPNRTVSTSIRWDHIDVEWDAAYRAGIEHCEKIRKDVDRKRIPLPIPRLPGERYGRPDDDLPNLLDVLGSVVNTNPALANSLIDQIGKTAGISNLDVLARLRGRQFGR